MTMLSIPRALIAFALLLPGCFSLEDDTGKNACNVQADCLSGYQCTNGFCVGTGGGGGSGGGDDDGSINVPDGGTSSNGLYGTVEPMTAQSLSVTAANYDTLVGATSVAGTLGCAVTNSLQASPGTAAAVVYANIYSEGGDARCRQGTFAIRNDPQACAPSYPGWLGQNCALYKRWDANGQQVANVLAIGGYVQMNSLYVTDSVQRCSGTINVSFAGGITVTQSFQFDFNPYAPASSHCVH